MNRQAKDREKIFAKHIYLYDKGLMFRIYKELNLKIRRQTTPLKKIKQKSLKDRSQRKIYK